jgi:hypothetical protein
LFVRLWRVAGPWDATTALLASYHPPDQAFERAILSAAEQNSAQTAHDALQSLVPGALDTKDERSKVLAIMRGIDTMFLRIHPRTIRLPRSRPPLPQWLVDLRDLRAIRHDYGQFGVDRLIPRGPLTRGPRQHDASYASSLPDRFSALSVVSQKLMHETRAIPIVLNVVSANALRGVGPGSAPGQEAVTVVPVAEGASDLAMSTQTVGNVTLADYRVHASVKPAAVLESALRAAGAADIALAPELIVCEDDADVLEACLSGASLQCRLVVAGSGQTRDKRDDLPWNESVAFNAVGTKLWRQRKIWPAGINPVQGLRYGMAPSNGNKIYEATASGDELVIADIDTLGRCVILICQDVQTAPLSDEVIRQYQPDWVFVPILDHDINEGRWAHKRTWELSTKSHARFIVACSTALFRHLGKPGEPNCALAIGPQDATTFDKGREVLLRPIAPGTSPGYFQFRWGDPGWSFTTLSAADP